jgi:hypothetical protein
MCEVRGEIYKFLINVVDYYNYCILYWVMMRSVRGTGERPSGSPTPWRSIKSEAGPYVTSTKFVGDI